MKYSGVGGQAVMEGIMMRNADKYAIAVRKPDKEIDIQSFDYKGIIKNAQENGRIYGYINGLKMGISTYEKPILPT